MIWEGRKHLDLGLFYVTISASSGWLVHFIWLVRSSKKGDGIGSARLAFSDFCCCCVIDHHDLGK